jgi:hypothetical protein
VTGSYAAISNLGSATPRNAINISQAGFNTATSFTLDHFSFFNCGRVNVAVNTNVSLTNGAFTGGLDAVSGDFEMDESGALAITRVIHDVYFGLMIKLVSPQTWDIQRVAMAPATLSNYQSMGPSACNEILTIIPGNTGDAILPCNTVNYWLVLSDGTNQTPHLTNVGELDGQTQNISNLYCDQPESNGIQEGKCIVANGFSPTNPTPTNISNLLQVPRKDGTGGAWLFGGAGPGFANQLVTITHATSNVADVAVAIDEGGTGALSISLEASIITGGSGFLKTQSLNPSAPCNNCAKLVDYNVATGTYSATDSLCSNCTNQGNGYGTKCTPTTGVSCPAGTHDVDVVHGSPVAAGFANTNFRFATWDTLGLPANAACTPWATGTVYTYVQSAPTCVSVQNLNIYQTASVNYRLVASHTSGASTKPDSGASWRNDWEYASKYDFRKDLASGTLYSGNHTIKAFWNWVGTGWTPTNALYRTTFPGDTNTVTNLGAFQMTAPPPTAPSVFVVFQEK